jgi:alpha-methylacyl-CoA racemase
VNFRQFFFFPQSQSSIAGLEIPGKYNQSSNLDEMRNEFSCIFKKKSRDLWMEVFEELDACVTPLLTLQEAPFHPHHQCRRSFYQEKTKQWQPRPSPRPITDPQLKRPEEKIPLEELLHHGQNTFEILSQIGYREADFKAFLDDQIITNSSLQ